MRYHKYSFAAPYKETLRDKAARHGGSLLELLDEEFPVLSKLLLAAVGGGVLALLVSSAVLGFPFG